MNGINLKSQFVKCGDWFLYDCGMFCGMPFTERVDMLFYENLEKYIEEETCEVGTAQGGEYA